ncbi:Myc-type [Macleaya cordata]|uniref:Myc-type n=1 Tax=Macleaya cordata TaxID=56857 RepID=A0A200QA51_MACCD|nr:Myc-type [Macleaya cordata]
MSEIFSNGWSFNYFNENPSLDLPNSSFERFEMSTQPDFSSSLNDINCPFGDGSLIPAEINSSYQNLDSSPTFTTHHQEEDYPLITEDEIPSLLGNDPLLKSEENQTSCKVEPIQPTDIPVLDMGLCLERKNRVKKVEGQPSKNLMAERRRRKRLNDRLSMLRSVVPKISKMDRTSILGDTIDYMKELLERINNLRAEIEVGSNQLNLMDILKDIKPKEILIRNTPKFDVERRNTDTRIDICCSGKPGLLLSTVTTIEALGLEIQQCVLSCFNEFAMQASCSEELEQRTVISSEEIKQALCRSAGYGGRFL